MRFKKGSKVEVLSKKDVPAGSWRCAEILCGNGHNYTVRYDGYPDATDDAVVERVPRKAVRPCPPSVEVSENWVPGDVVEVFDSFSWKMATILTVLVRKFFLVRLLGSSQEFKVSRFDIRVRQSWQDDEWIMIGKSSRNFEDGKRNEKLALEYNQNLSSKIQQKSTKMNQRVKDDCFDVKNKIIYQESHIVSSKTLKKRSPYCYSQVEACTGRAQKFRVIENEGRCHRAIAASANPSRLSEKVVAIASPREMPGDEYISASFKKRTTGFAEMDVERVKSKGAVGHSLAVTLESNSADSITCSVGSCSITSSNPYKLFRQFSTGPVENIESHSSDAESLCRCGYEEGNFPLPTEEELAAEIHRLELHAYRCTMEALHASGPLSWEQETLVTNLRLSLHISNDEHLMELKNLVCAETIIPIS